MTNQTTRDLIQKILELDESVMISTYSIQTDNKGKIQLIVEYVNIK